MPFEKTCERCGVLFSVHNRRRFTEARFCSMACTREPRRVLACAHCGSEFTAGPGDRANRRFCSQRCWGLNRYPSIGPIMNAKLRGTKPKNFARVEIACAQCGKQFAVSASGVGIRKCCSKACANLAQRSTNPLHYSATLINGKVRKDHIRLAEELLGRPLRRGENVHHINRNRRDNRTANLVVLQRAQHGSIHSQGRWHGREFTIEDIKQAFPDAIWLEDLAQGRRVA